MSATVPAQPGATRTQHRVYLGRLVDGADPEAAALHWWHRHPDVVRALPGIKGYVQGRIPRTWWSRSAFFTCAETWFDSRVEERAAFSSAYYRDVVVPDERNVIKADGAWNSAVLDTDIVVDAPRTRYRALCFGASADDVRVGQARVEVHHLHRPLDGTNPTVVAVWTDDLAVAESVAASGHRFSLVTEPVVVIAPNEDWSIGRPDPAEVST
jgi:hypothetical protein